MRNLLAGLRDHWRAQRLLFRKGLWPLFLVPGIISLLYFPVSILLAITLLTGVADFVHDQWVPGFLQGTVTMWALAVFFWFAGIYLGFLMFRNVVMIICSPVLAHLSEAAEDRQVGVESNGFDWKEALHSAGRGTAMSLISLVLALAGFALSWLLALIPVVGGLLAILFLPCVQFYLAGVGFCDPPLERRQASIGGTFRHAWRHRGRMIGHGMGFSLLLLIPFAGWFVAPSYGIVAGTLGVVEIEGEE